MLLPYVSYLRVYEPAGDLAVSATGPTGGDQPVETVALVTLRREQDIVLSRVVTNSVSGRAGDESDGCYALRRGGALYLCPVDLTVRTWLAIAAVADHTGTSAELMLPGPPDRVVVAQEYADWRQRHPSALPHIQQSTWGVPRTWFLLVAQEEQERYYLAGVPSLRFRATISDARRRLMSAVAVLNATIDDEELSDELAELGTWLAGFPNDCWVELDYAGAARLLGAELAKDRSAYEITHAVRAIARRDFAAAGESYRQFVERWRSVAALERAN